MLIKTLKRLQQNFIKNKISNLEGLDNILDEQDGLQLEEDVVNFGEEAFGQTGHLISRQGDINIQKWLQKENHENN